MANLKPSDLPRVRSIKGDDIFIVETDPNNAFDLTVNKIEKGDLFSGYLNDVSNIGLGETIYSGLSGSSILIKSLVQGAGMAISDRGQDLVISYTGSEESTTASNIGDGIGIVSGISNFDIKIKSISGGSNIELVESDNTLVLSFTGQTEATTVSNMGSGIPLVSGIDGADVKIRSLEGGSNISVSNSGTTVYVDFTGTSPGGGGTSNSVPFAFFSNAINNGGIISKSYYNTPTSNTYLSGIDVDSASDITLYLRWDGPDNSYMGSGFINGQQIPTSNISELGSYTRRFEGYISGLNLAGKTEVTGIANGFTGIISLSEAGAGPTPLSVIISPISSGAAKAGTYLGTTDLKGGDTIDVFATFSTSDVTGIKVYNSGISDGVDYTQYPLIDTGDGNHTATIPVIVNSSRSGPQGISVVAKNNFGTAGNDFSSSNTIGLDQIYPSISTSNPTSYNGRSDGLRSGESTSFSNSISNWTDGVDYILYETLSNEISITGSGTYQNPMSVDYVQGIYNDSNNLRISASRTGNGATDSSEVKIKIANGPVITGMSLSSTASSATAPDQIGLTEIKGGDTVQSEVYINGNGVAGNNIDIYVLSDGVSNGMQQNWSSYSYSTMADGSFKYTVPVQVTSSTARDGDQNISMRPKNNFGTIGDDFSSTDTAIVNNSNYPSVSISSISYPGSQDALKDAESATVSNNVSVFDSVAYSSPNSNLTIASSTTFEASKTVSRQAGSYNISSNNFTITATKDSNGMVRSDSTVVNIADSSMSLSIANLASELQSSSGGISDNFNLNSDQKFLEIPSLETNSSQVSGSQLIYTSSGINPNANDFRITVRDSDTKGTFAWVVSGLNLAGKLTNVISVNPNYTLVGFSERTISASPTSIGAGLAYIGTSVSQVSNVNMENISEGGSGPNAGTIYSPEITGDGVQMTNSFDIDNKFVITDSAGITSSTGDHLFNLDKLNRAANTSVLNPAQFVVSEN